MRRSLAPATAVRAALIPQEDVFVFLIVPCLWLEPSYRMFGDGVDRFCNIDVFLGGCSDPTDETVILTILVLCLGGSEARSQKALSLSRGP